MIVLPSSLHGFELLKTRDYPDLHLRAALLRHNPSGAVLYHFDRDDPVSAFLVAFRTPPTDSSGVQHILEHTALCGSARFPVRDPFFKMLTRSFATFMNAMTATDYTMYPFSTLNKNDYANLLRVYLDAVFRPNLLPQDFAQEGWRIEHADPLDRASPLELKGVVFSEMKGVMSDTASLFQYAAMKQVFRGSLYEHVSGGEPLDIPALSHADLVAYHRAHYTPRAAHFFTYGRADQVLPAALPEIAAMLDNVAVVSHSADADADADPANPPALPIWPQPTTTTTSTDAFDNLETVYEACAPDPAGDPERQTRMCVSFVTNDAKDTYTTFAMSVLSDLLMSGASSPLHCALVASGLATQFAPNVGYDHSTRPCTLTMGAQGLRGPADVERAQTIIRDVLRACARDGFEDSKIDAILHGRELSLLRMSPKFGMNLLMRAANSAIMDVDAFDALDAVNLLRCLRNDKGVYQRLLRDLVLGCRHRAVRLVMAPSADYVATMARKERELLDARVAKLTSADRERIFEVGKDLLARQDAPQDLSVLPCLELADIEPRAPDFPLEQGAAAPTYSRASKTNGIAYVNSISLLPADMDKDLIPALPLFANALTWQGTKAKTMEQLDVEIRSSTGGISFCPSVILETKDSKDYEIALRMSSHSLEDKVSDVARLVLELVNDTNFENEDRLRVLISMSTSDMMDNLAYSGHAYALKLAASIVDPGAHINDQWHGLAQLRYLTELGSDDQKVKELVKKLLKIREIFLKSAVTRTHIVATEAKLAQVKKSLSENLVAKYPHSSGAKSTKIVVASAPSSSTPLKEIYVPVPFQVGFAACAVRTDVLYVHEDTAALQVGAQLLSQLYMHREVREKGGAYGGGASFDPTTGVFSMYSYRDPRVAETRRKMDAGVAWLTGDSKPSAATPSSTPPEQPTAQQLLEAKLKIFAQMDAPEPPGSEGWVEFESRRTLEMRQKRRDRLFAVTTEDVRRVAKKYLALDSRKEATFAIVGPETLKEQFAKDGWTIQMSDK